MYQVLYFVYFCIVPGWIEPVHITPHFPTLIELQALLFLVLNLVVEGLSEPVYITPHFSMLIELRAPF